MKSSLSIIAISFSMLCITSCEKVIPTKDIPAEIKSYTSTHFSDCSIDRAVKEKGENNEMYEISLSCGCKLEFDKNKNILDIDCPTELPESVIPSNILAYVNSNYSTNHIIGWEIQNSNQNVELDNNITLVFNMQGEFLHKDS